MTRHPEGPGDESILLEDEAAVTAAEFAGAVMPRQDGHQQGSVIGGKYEVRKLLGKGGQGIVYLAYNRERNVECALKTFLPEFLNNPAMRRVFRDECQAWVNLPEHPFVIAAQWIQEIHGQLFVQMDYVPADEHRRTTLNDHLFKRGPKPDTAVIARWALQFCLGMEHAAASGIRCHRDIKPANILISSSGEVRIADFGLASAASTAARAAGQDQSGLPGHDPCGTPGYMAPEIYRGDGADVRSDVYSFGLVLWQLATGQPFLPFPGKAGDMHAHLRAVYEQQMAGPPPVGGPFAELIRRCLMAEAGDRFSDFAELRHALEQRFPEPVRVTQASLQPDSRAVIRLSNRGASLHTLGRYAEALKCYEDALRIDPAHVRTWNNTANTLVAVGRHEDAIKACRRGLQIDPNHAQAMVTEAIALRATNRLLESLSSCDRAVELSPGDSPALCERGKTLLAMGRPIEAVENFDRVLSIDDQNAAAWTGKGHALTALASLPQAVECFEHACAIDPQDPLTWNDLGNCLTRVGKLDQAKNAYIASVRADAHYAAAWSNLGNTLHRLGAEGDAIVCYRLAVKLDTGRATPWVNLGTLLLNAGKPQEAADSYRSALNVNPDMIQAWRGLGHALEAMHRLDEAQECFRRELELQRRRQNH